VSQPTKPRSVFQHTRSPPRKNTPRMVTESPCSSEGTIKWIRVGKLNKCLHGGAPVVRIELFGLQSSHMAKPTFGKNERAKSRQSMKHAESKQIENEGCSGT
jgi:hypothetical protein